MKKKQVFLSVFIKTVFALTIMLLAAKVHAQTSHSDTIKIGLLISNPQFQDAKRGAEFAIKKAAEQNFMGERNIHLVTRSMEGPWGTGAKQTVDLVFNQKVWAIVGSHDGKNAHLAEQVIAKTQVVYISAWSGDPTLAQAYVPWFFSMVPNNIKQAKSLYTEICSHGDPGKVCVVSDQSYDSENALKYFLEECKNHKVAEPIQLKYDAADFRAEEVLSEIKRANAKVLILFGKPQESVLIQKKIQGNALPLKVFTTLESLGEYPGNSFSWNDFKGATVPDLQYIRTTKGKQFENDYLKEFGENASPTAVYSYDAVWLILKQIKDSGYDREAFKQQMRDANLLGLTGNIQFDSIGNRIQKVKWILVE